MKLEKRVPSGREKDEASVKLLETLREQLYSSNVSIVRQSAFHLSWLQDDGLDILKEALFGDTPKRAKSAAAYGLRKMRGRMKKMGEQALTQGLSHPDPSVAEVCRNAFLVMRRKGSARRPSARRGKGQRPRLDIREIPHRPAQTRPGVTRRPRDNFSRR